MTVKLVAQYQPEIKNYFYANSNKTEKFAKLKLFIDLVLIRD